MAGERRTRSEKEKAQLHRQEHLTYTFHSDHGVKMSGEMMNKPVTPKKDGESKKNRPQVTDLFAYDTKLIYQDLMKTVVITGLILLAVIGVKVGLQ